MGHIWSTGSRVKYTGPRREILYPGFRAKRSYVFFFLSSSQSEERKHRFCITRLFLPRGKWRIIPSWQRRVTTNIQRGQTTNVSMYNEFEYIDMDDYFRLLFSHIALSFLSTSNERTCIYHRWNYTVVLKKGTFAFPGIRRGNEIAFAQSKNVKTKKEKKKGERRERISYRAMLLYKKRYFHSVSNLFTLNRE